MSKSEERLVFISIFYNREKWHLLLQAIRTELFQEPEIRKKCLSINVFLSLHRGPNIRLAIKFNSSAEEVVKLVENRMYKFLCENPSTNQPFKLPIGGFFSDYPNNQIRYNLFNSRVIRENGFETFQELMSKILVQFFDDHPVDEDGVFTLIVYLHQSILNGISPKDSTKQKLCLQLIEFLHAQEENFSSLLENIRLQEDIRLISHKQVNKDLLDLPIVDELFQELESASRLLYNTSGKIQESYLAMLSMIQLHVFKLPVEVIIDSLNHIYQNELIGEIIHESD